jgi:hypothetical protein
MDSGSGSHKSNSSRRRRAAATRRRSRSRSRDRKYRVSGKASSSSSRSSRRHTRRQRRVQPVYQPAHHRDVEYGTRRPMVSPASSSSSLGLSRMMRGMAVQPNAALEHAHSSSNEGMPRYSRLQFEGDSPSYSLPSGESRHTPLGLMDALDASRSASVARDTPRSHGSM